MLSKIKYLLTIFTSLLKAFTLFAYLLSIISITHKKIKVTLF
jgi:hypothetical protein